MTLGGPCLSDHDSHNSCSFRPLGGTPATARQRPAWSAARLAGHTELKSDLRGGGGTWLPAPLETRVSALGKGVAASLDGGSCNHGRAKREGGSHNAKKGTGRRLQVANTGTAISQSSLPLRPSDRRQGVIPVSGSLLQKAKRICGLNALRRCFFPCRWPDSMPTTNRPPTGGGACLDFTLATTEAPRRTARHVAPESCWLEFQGGNLCRRPTFL